MLPWRRDPHHLRRQFVERLFAQHPRVVAEAARTDPRLLGAGPMAELRRLAEIATLRRWWLLHGE